MGTVRDLRPTTGRSTHRAYRPQPETPPATPVVSSARLAMVMVLAAETMFFAGLIGAYLVVRFGSAVWPPPNLPSLPLAVTWLNTIVLSVSGLTMLSALAAVRRDDSPALRQRLLITLVLGGTFVAVQGSEWVRLVHHGFTLASGGSYGSTFYVLIGMHGLHVLGAIGWLAFVLVRARSGRYRAQSHTGLELCTFYWSFVCVLWLFIFGLVYQ